MQEPKLRHNIKVNDERESDFNKIYLLETESEEAI